MNESLLQPVGGIPLVIWLLGLLVLSLFVVRCRKVRIVFKSKQREIVFETETAPVRRLPSNATAADAGSL